MVIDNGVYVYDYETSVKYVEQLTSNCDEVQRQVLAEILRQNLETEYLKGYGISNACIIDPVTFKKNVPIITYEDVKPYIQRIYHENFSPILCAQPITELWMSSGTTEGQYKLFPITEDEKDRRDRLFFAVTPYINRCIEGENNGDKGKAFGVFVIREAGVSPNRITTCAGTTSFFKNLKFYKDKPYPHNKNTSPMEAIFCPDHFQSAYIQLLCGFYQRHDVTHFKAMFGSSFIWIIHLIKKYYSELCHDISTGDLSLKITYPSLRAYMLDNFMQKPNPELAKFIENVCVKDDWEGIFIKIWPNVRYLDSILTGSMTQYIPLIRYYTGGSVPLLSTKYNASECDLGFNLVPTCDPYDVSYTIMPNMAYYEFLPLDSPENETVDLANVEVGKEYEIVVTNFCGLYRFRIGDVLTPTGFYNSTPQFKFVRRNNVLLSIDMCKTTETELQDAIDSASSLLGLYDAKIVDYTSYIDLQTSPGHYVIYMELLMDKLSQSAFPSKEVLQQCCLTMESKLGAFYRNLRVGESVGPLEICVVRNNTFEKLREYAISRGTTHMQYKVPRCVKLPGMLELLDSHVISTNFSPLVPPPPPVSPK